jgi:DNA replication protein DnaC
MEMINCESFFCRKCNGEFSKLLDSGLCITCADNSAWDDRRRKTAQSFFPQKAWEEFTFEKFEITSDNKSAFEICKQFNPATDNLYLFGKTEGGRVGVGTGKSHLAYATVRKWSEKLRIGIYKQPDIFRLFRKKSEKEEKEMLDRFTNYEVLLIDDLGIAKQTDFSYQILYEIIDSRYMANRNGLILTSNLTIADFSEKSEDSRIADRLFEMCIRVRMEADVSWRVKKRNIIEG